MKDINTEALKPCPITEDWECAQMDAFNKWMLTASRNINPFSAMAGWMACARAGNVGRLKMISIALTGNADSSERELMDAIFQLQNSALSQPPAVQKPVAFVSKEGNRLVGILRQELPVGTDLYLHAKPPRRNK